MNTTYKQLTELSEKHNAKVLIAKNFNMAPVDWVFLINGQIYDGYDYNEIEEILNVDSINDLIEKMTTPVEKIYLCVNADNEMDKTLTEIFKIY